MAHRLQLQWTSHVKVGQKAIPAVSLPEANHVGKDLGLELKILFQRPKFAGKSLQLDGPIRVNRFADSRESPHSRESFQGSQAEPLFYCESCFGGGGLKIANRRFEAIRANCSHVLKIRVFLRIDSRESPRFALRTAAIYVPAIPQKERFPPNFRL